MGRRVNVIGVGMTKFAKPGESEDYHVMASKAARTALKDAGVPFESVEQAYAAWHAEQMGALAETECAELRGVVVSMQDKMRQASLMRETSRKLDP